jgi:DNA-binding transcriptional LysR family regulator
VLDARRLLVLREVARRGSLSAASESLRYTTSAVSQQIAALERETGVRLLERRARGVVLTEAGQVLLGHAERVFHELDAAEAALADLAALRRGRVRLASFATAGASIVPATVDRFRAHYPDIEIQVEQATSLDGINRLRSGRLDVVLAVDQPAAPDLDVIALLDDPFRLALPHTHPLADVAGLTLADLPGERWVDVPSEIPGGGVLARTLTALGVPFRLAHESDDYTAIHEMVGAGLGLALLPNLALFPPNPDVALRDLGPDAPTRRVQAVTRGADFRSPAASALLDVLRAVAAQRGGQAGVRSAPSRYPAT